MLLFLSSALFYCAHLVRYLRTFLSVIKPSSHLKEVLYFCWLVDLLLYEFTFLSPSLYWTNDHPLTSLNLSSFHINLRDSSEAADNTTEQKLATFFSYFLLYGSLIRVDARKTNLSLIAQLLTILTAENYIDLPVKLLSFEWFDSSIGDHSIP